MVGQINYKNILAEVKNRAPENWTDEDVQLAAQDVADVMCWPSATTEGVWQAFDRFINYLAEEEEIARLDALLKKWANI